MPMSEFSDKVSSSYDKLAEMAKKRAVTKNTKTEEKTSGSTRKGNSSRKGGKGYTAPSLVDEEEIVVIPSPQQDACNPVRGVQFSYRKRIAILGLMGQAQQNTVDLPNILQRYPKALLQELNQDRLITIDGTQFYLEIPGHYPSGKIVAPIHDQVTLLAKQLGSQLIISGRIVDLSTQKKSSWYQQPLELFKSPNRHIAIEIQIYDGLTGTLIHSELQQESTRDSMNMNRPAVMSQSFLLGDLGESLSSLLKKQAHSVHESLACLPMLARITHINRDGIHFDAGIDSFLRPGDRLRLFRRVPMQSIPGSPIQYRDQAYGHLKVVRVYPRSATGVIDGDDNPFPNNRLAPGDLVRAW